MGRPLLLFGGLASIAIAALHVVIVFIGPPAYRYFGAGEALARQAELGSLFPATLTLIVATAFALFGAYALSGAGTLRRLPLLRLGLTTIGVIYTLRGLLLVPQALYVIRHRISPFHR